MLLTVSHGVNNSFCKWFFLSDFLCFELIIIILPPFKRMFFFYRKGKVFNKMFCSGTKRPPFYFNKIAKRPNSVSAQVWATALFETTFLNEQIPGLFFNYFFMDDEGMKDDKQMMIYWAISSHFIPQNRRGSVNTWSKCDYTDGQQM